MSVERLELPDGQWADIEYRPTHGVIRKIGKDTDRVSRNDPLAGEDVLISNLVKDWHVVDEKGESVALKREDYDRIPQDVFSLITDECMGIVERAYPNQRAAR